MRRDRADRSSLRLFVAAYPPAGLAEALLSLAREKFPLMVRWIPADHVHLTLQFVGETSPKELGEVVQSVSRACSGMEPFDLVCESMITLPRLRPRLAAVTTSAPPALLEIQRRLAHRLARVKKQDAVFLPHLTLCREATGLQAMTQAIEPLAWRVDAVLLMASELRPSGAEHREVARAELGG